MGEIGLVLVQVLYLVLTGVLFSVFIACLSWVVEGAQVWLIFLVRYFCTRSGDRPGQEVKIFL